MLEGYLNVKDFAQAIGKSERLVHKLIGEKRIQAERVGLQWLIPVAEVERYKAEIQKPVGRPSTKK